MNYRVPSDLASVSYYEEALTNLYVGYLAKSKHKEGKTERKG